MPRPMKSCVAANTRAGVRAHEVIEQVHEMDGVGEHDAAVIARAFEAAEVAPQNLHPTKLAGLDGLAQPLRRRVEPEDVPHLQDAVLLLRQLGQLARLL